MQGDVPVKLPAEMRGADNDLREMYDIFEGSVRDEIRVLHEYMKVQFSVQSEQLQELLSQLKGAFPSRADDRLRQPSSARESSIDFSRLDKLMSIHGLDLEFGKFGKTDVPSPDNLEGVGQLLAEHGIVLAEPHAGGSAGSQAGVRSVKEEPRLSGTDSEAARVRVKEPPRHSETPSIVSLPPALHHEEHRDTTNDSPESRDGTREGLAEKRDSSRFSFVRSKLLAQHQIAREAASQVALAPPPQEEKVSSTNDLVGKVVSSNLFVYGIMLLIFINLLLLGIEVEMSMTLGQDDVPTWFETLNLMIVIIFVVEIVMKLFAFGCRDFFMGADGHWNVFDLIIIMLSVVETVLDFWAASQSASQVELSHLRVMRFMRLARTLRGIRVIRLLRYVGALRTLVFSILNTLKSLLWTLILLCLSLG